jgi:type IV pilus assembly protein PilC
MAIEINKIKTNSKKTQAQTGESKSIFDFLNKEISLFGKQLKDKKKESFYTELGILIISGIDIRTALEIITEEQKAGADRDLFSRINNDVINGDSLSEAMLKTGKFTMYEYYSLKIGEESGRMKEVLNDLSIYFSKKIKQRRQLSSAFTYPAMVIATAIIAVTFMLNFIVPMFVDVFKRFNSEIPAITSAVISASAMFKKYGLLVLIVFIALVVWILMSRNKPWYRRFSSRLLLKLPFFGEITRKIYITRFCQSMSLLLGAKTPMLKSIQLVRQMIGFYPYEKALDAIERGILHGEPLFTGMQKTNLFDARIISLTRVAEEVNQLDTMFTRLGNQYSDELEYRTSMLNNLLEPIMIVLVGGLVAFILIAMYLPLFQLSSSVY